MNSLNQNLLLLCTDSAPTFLSFFDLTIAPQLLFYSYIPISIMALFLSLFVLFKTEFSTVSKYLLLFTISFILMMGNEILLWTAAPVSLIYFGWSLIILLQLVLVISVLYFSFVFIYKKVSWKLNALTLLLALPAIILLPTTLNVAGFDLVFCEGINGPLWYYQYLLELIASGFLFVVGMKKYLKYRDNKNSKTLPEALVSLSSAFLIFLLFFSSVWSNYSLVYEVNLLFPVGVLVFLFVISYIIVRFKRFNIKLAAPVVLVFGLWILVFSLLFVRNIEIVQVIVSITLLLLFISGYALIKSVRKEISHREQIEILAGKLKKANVRLKELDKLKSEFVSIASHQLRSPLTAVSGYTSLLQEGAYGKLPAKAMEPVERINKSVRRMAQSIEEYLNVSRIESGNMKYNLSDFNLVDQVESICDGLRAGGLRKGLVILCKRNLTGRGVVNADIGKTQQVIYNLIDNATKYTEKGSITVSIYDDLKKKRIFVEISDTGIGMSEATLDTIFQKFERANNANTVNIKGTGLGLYVAQKMAEAMGGSIEAYSEGEGKGSRFVLELPMVM